MKDSFGKRQNYNPFNREEGSEDRIDRAVNEEQAPIPKDNNLKARRGNRAYDVSRDGDDQASIEIGLEDIDKTMIFQFDENFNFHVSQNNESVKVPIIYNMRERWEWARRNQKLRTVNDKIVFPLIVFERTSVSRDTSRENANTLTQQVYDLGTPYSSVWIASTKWSKRNRYDKFSVLNDRVPQREFYIVSSPNYVEVNYDFSVYTEYMFQMNKILEQVSYLSNEYWGNPDGNMFKTNVDNFSVSVEMEGEVRYLRGEFSATVRGYIIPEYVADEAKTKKAYTISKVQMNEKIVSAEELDNI